MRLGLKADELKRIFRDVVRNIHSCKLEDMAGNFLLSYLLYLVDFERLMCKALTQMDEESFRSFRRHGKTDMLLLWDVFTDLLWEKRKEAKKFYETKLRELDDPSMETGYVARTKDGWIVNIDTCVKYLQALADVELKHAELIVSILQNALDICKKNLEWARQEVYDPERVREGAQKFLKRIGRPLSYEELNQLKELIIEKSKQKR